MAIAGLQGCSDSLVGGELVGFEGAEADEGDAVTGVQQSSGLLVGLRKASSSLSGKHVEVSSKHKGTSDYS